MFTTSTTTRPPDVAVELDDRPGGWAYGSNSVGVGGRHTPVPLPLPHGPNTRSAFGHTPGDLDGVGNGSPPLPSFLGMVAGERGRSRSARRSWSTSPWPWRLGDGGAGDEAALKLVFIFDHRDLNLSACN